MPDILMRIKMFYHTLNSFLKFNAELNYNLSICDSTQAVCKKCYNQRSKLLSYHVLPHGT